MSTKEDFNEEEHNQEMIAKVEAIENESNPTPKEEDSKTETEVEEETTTEEEVEEGSESEEDTLEDEAEEAVEQAGLNMEDLQAEFDKDGQLSSESYLALERAGIPKSTVDNYINGLQAQSQLIEMKAYETVGGKENYQAITSWAADNLSEDEIEAFNSSLGNPSGAQFRLALQGLQARYQTQNGSMTDNIGGLGRGSIEVFESLEQVRVAMSDKRYSTDKAYQKQVADKLQRSNLM